VTTIIDYGAGNLRSVQNTLDELKAEYVVTNQPQMVQEADKLLLPGVGHFGQMMTALDRLRLRDPILNRMRAGVPMLGICLGLQSLFETSEESPESRGLGLFPGTVKRFTGDIRIPHMGWNSLSAVRETRLFKGLKNEPYAYFAHSFYVPVMEATVATCTYAQPYTAVLERENIFGVQFHPEKSGPVGLQIVKNFLNL
jgi:imidazole glycerol phosphate synthase glutamine amidotransferase subunit